MKRAINYLEAIRKYEIEKYDDYDRRNELTMRERMANENARNVLEGLLKHLEGLNAEEPKEEKQAEEVKENSNVGTDGNGEVSAEAVHGSGIGLAEKVPEIHTELSETGTAETSKG